MKKEIDGQLSIFDLPKDETGLDTSQCEGCHYRDCGKYKVDEYGYTWKYLCPGNATANWPHGTPMNVSAPLIMPDGYYYENNIVDGVPHIHCWKKKDAKRYINRYEVKEALEEVIGEPFEYNVKFDEWQCKVKKVIYSFKMSSAEYHNKQTKEGDDIILLAADKNKEGTGGPCDSIDEAIEMPKKYIERFNENEVVCGFSKHECNKEELWDVADDLDEFMCPHTCCRKCTTTGCGARCNGSEEPKKQKELPEHKTQTTIPDRHKYIVDFCPYVVESMLESTDLHKFQLTKFKEHMHDVEYDVDKGLNYKAFFKVFKKSFLEYSDTWFFHVEKELYSFEKSVNDESIGFIHHCGQDHDIVIANLLYVEVWRMLVESLETGEIAEYKKEEPERISDFKWHSIEMSTPPNNSHCKFKYVSTSNPKVTYGAKDGYWRRGRDQQTGVPMDDAILTEWIRIPKGTKPTCGRVECEYDDGSLCDRYREDKEERGKSMENLPKGFACSGCCHYCREAPMFGGKCKFDCRLKKEDYICQ